MGSDGQSQGGVHGNSVEASVAALKVNGGEGWIVVGGMQIPAAQTGCVTRNDKGADAALRPPRGHR